MAGEGIGRIDRLELVSERIADTCVSKRASLVMLPEALDPLGQRLRTPAERRVHRRFVSAQRLVAGHDAFGQRVLGEVGAQARRSVGEVAHIDAYERALFCPGQLFLTALHEFTPYANKRAQPYALRTAQ